MAQWWPGWYIHHKKWWMIQYCFDGWFSLGLHIEPRTRRAHNGLRFGPYLDLHLGCLILSFGLRPYLSGDADLFSSVARGGYKASK